MCREFRKGWCHKGALCLFLHESQQGGASTSTSDQICYQFRAGSCSRGSECKFSHLDLQFTQLKKEKKENGQERFCFPFQKGECKRGDLCRFAHRLGAASNYGICFAYAKGECEKGDDCKFQHVGGGVDQGSAAVVNQGAATPPVVRICYAFKTEGNCSKGDECTYAHVRNTRTKTKRTATTAGAGTGADDDVNAVKRQKLSKKERNKKAAVIRARGFKRR